MKEKVYRFRYTADNRVKSIHESEEEKMETNAHWWVVVIGAIVAVGWWFAWV